MKRALILTLALALASLKQKAERVKSRKGQVELARIPWTVI